MGIFFFKLATKSSGLWIGYSSVGKSISCGPSTLLKRLMVLERSPVVYLLQILPNVKAILAML